jgi:phosphomannomutase
MIKFGTDGWRGIIARDFTFENIRIAAYATVIYLKKQGKANLSAVVGYDTRFLSNQFAAEVASVFAENGIKVYLSHQICSTPQVSYNTKILNADIGIIITASHNPPEYSGYKLKANYGGPATPEMIAEVEKEIPALIQEPPTMKLKSVNEYVKDGSIVLKDFKETYLNYINEKIDIAGIRKEKLNILFDPMFGAGINTMGYLFPYLEELHSTYNPSFGELDHPEPIESMLGLLKARTAQGFDIGLASDGDADRLGAVDEKGNFVDAHKIYMIILKYLHGFKNLSGKIVKTVSLTSMVDKYAKKYNLELIETPVGFKYSADLMSKGGVLIGGEESGGLGTCLHIPERDGIFNGLLLIEAMLNKKMKLSELVDELNQEFGLHVFERVDKQVTIAEKERILKAATNTPDYLGDYKVIGINLRDGYKFFVDNGWLLIRASGTEPLIRFYAEAENIEKVRALIKAAIELK